MSARHLLLEKFMLLFIILISICFTSNSTKSCSSYKSTDYIGKDDVENDITFGDCSFEQNLCNYTQGCKDDDAHDWTESQGGAVCLGRDTGDYDSFSVLLSPLLSITQNTSLAFYYSQWLPGKLSVFLATTSGITEVYTGQDTDGFLQHVLYINSSVAKVGFRARKARSRFNVTLSYVKLTADPRFTTTPARVTVTRTSTIRDHSVVASSTQTTQVPETGKSFTPDQLATAFSTESVVMLVTEKQEGRSNVGIIVGVLVAVIAVVVAGVVAGIFILRLRKKRQNCSDRQTEVKDRQTIYPSADTRHNDETAFKSNGKNPHNVLGASINRYDIPHLPDLAFPSAADEEHIYHSLEEPDTIDVSQAQCIYSFAMNEGANSSNADNSEGNYDRTGSPAVIPRWEGESSSGPVEDYYNHMGFADISREKVVGRGDSTQGMASGRHESDCDEDTSREDEDGYNVLCAGNKQPSSLNDQKNRAANAYDHVTGDVHGDYDRIRQGERKGIGCDYDHVI